MLSPGPPVCSSELFSAPVHRFAVEEALAAAQTQSSKHTKSDTGDASASVHDSRTMSSFKWGVGRHSITDVDDDDPTVVFKMAHSGKQAKLSESGVGSGKSSRVPKRRSDDAYVYDSDDTEVGGESEIAKKPRGRPPKGKHSRV